MKQLKFDFMKKKKEKKQKIIKNAAKCKLCGNQIQSTYRHDFVSCKCGEIFVDGGLDYLRRGSSDFDNFIDLSEVVEEKDE